jgi:iron complex outermembrane receptor protein
MYHKINFFKFKKLIPIAIIFLAANQAHAEGLMANYSVSSQVNETITGNITDQEGSPIEGATVTVVETGATTTTDASGNYSISANIGQTLSISYDGYANQIVKISSTSVSVKLQSKKDATSIEEVTLVGYGSQKKSDLTGAVSQLKAENFKEGMNIFDAGKNRRCPYCSIEWRTGSGSECFNQGNRINQEWKHAFVRCRRCSVE